MSDEYVVKRHWEEDGVKVSRVMDYFATYQDAVRFRKWMLEDDPQGNYRVHTIKYYEQWESGV